MHKSFILISIVLSFLWGSNNAMGMEPDESYLSAIKELRPVTPSVGQDRAPGPDEWKDKTGRPAPPPVRKAADALWSAVSTEGSAAGDAGWRQKNLPPYCDFNPECCPKNGMSCCCRILFCGLMECFILGDRAAIPGADGEFIQVPSTMTPNLSGKRLVWDQRQKEMGEALNSFKSQVNSAVTKPEQYSGDADFCRPGPWVPDGKFVWGSAGLSGASFRSGCRDMTGVAPATMKFVNDHGGWTEESKIKGYVVIEKF